MIDLTDAACRYGDPDSWFSESSRTIADCLTTCHTCPILARCRVETLTEDLTTKGHIHGVRRRLDARARTVLRREARKAAA